MLNKYIAKDSLLRREEHLSKHINIVSHYADDTLLDKNGCLIKIIKLAGLDFVTKDGAMLDIFKNRRNSLFKGFSSDFAFYFWEMRSKVNAYPEGEFEPGYASDLNERYQHKIKQAELFQKELYLAVITKQPAGFLNKSFNLLEKMSHLVDKVAKQDYLKKRHKELNDVTQKVLSAFSDYHCELLSVYEKNSVKFSSLLDFVSRLINTDHYSVPLTISDASVVLPRKRLFFNRRSGTIEIRSPNGSKKFAAVLAIKAYQPFTYQGIFNTLELLKIEYVMTQSFRPFDQQVTKTTLRDQQSDMMQSKDESVSLTEEIDDAFDDAASGDVGYGLHHFTLVCYADAQDKLNQHVGTLLSAFSNLDITCVREDVASECGFWAQLPANFGYSVRPAVISTKNMAAFASFHNYPAGKITGNYWGPAVTVFETLSGSPYYFNFHYKDVGNFLIFGAMGSGKTVLAGLLIAQSVKFGGKHVIFDKDRGLEILVRALGGVYEIMRPGIATGFNPCQLEDTAVNRKFLAVLFKKLLTTQGELLTVQELEVIEHAIDGMYRLDQPSRQFCHIASFFGVKKRGTLRARFDQWHSNGAHAWVFDHATDSLNLGSNVIGFDLSHILADTDCKTPLLMYLTYRVEQALEGQRGMLFCDEGWKMLDDDYFKVLINNWSRTLRKKNNIFGLATQVANDAVNASISKSMIESSFCKIFFPNPSADRKVYIEDFGLSEHEYHLIKTLPDDQHYFLLNYGISNNKQSVVVRVNLSGLEDDIAIISGREHTLAIVDQLRLEVGDDPNKWLPLFHLRRKEGIRV